ncbi:MAG: phosphoribosyltransferase family protein [Bacteriovorax sp.]|nr:phosphoribosyltransferase family protein [Bacteriovorax sp.]
MIFYDRRHAGIELAKKVSKLNFDKKNTVVLGIWRGGVQVAFEVAKLLQLPLDVLIIEKIRAPYFSNISLGVISEGGEVFYNTKSIENVGYKRSEIGLLKDSSLKVVNKISESLRREYAQIPLKGKDIILIDDGIVFENVIENVLEILKLKKVKKVFIATPVASLDVISYFKNNMQDFAVININPMMTMEEYYQDFSPVSIEDTIDILSEFSSSQNFIYFEKILIEDLEIKLKGTIVKSEKIKSWIIYSNPGEKNEESFDRSFFKDLTNAGYAILILEDLESKQLEIAVKWLMKNKLYKISTPICLCGAVAKSLGSNISNLSLFAILNINDRLDIMNKKTLSSIYLPVLSLINQEALEVIEGTKIAAEVLPNSQIAILSKSERNQGKLVEYIIQWFDSHLPDNRTESWYSVT